MSNKAGMNIFRKANIWGFLLLVFTIPVAGQNLNWTAPNSSEYSNTANVIADIYLNDVELDNPGDQIAFFVGEEIRGLSTPISIGGSEYVHVVTLFSNQAMEAMDIKVYYQSSDLEFEVAEKFVFEDGGIYGSFDLPFAVEIYDDNNYPISLNDVADQTTLEGLPFEDINMYDYLEQDDDNDIEWSFTSNANLDVSIEDGVLQVEGASGFSGITTLIVKATKLPFNTFAETSINYNVTPFYEGPAWNNIPPQSILLGDQFDPLNLHDFEYQYGGPAIQYDYTPILVPDKNAPPKPIWELTKKYQVNMSAVFRMNYTPKHHFHHEDDALAAFVGNEVRGVTTIDSVSGLFFLTVGGVSNMSNPITLKFYSGEKKQVFTLDDVFDFTPYFVLGSPDLPQVIDLSPLLPQVPNIPITGGVASIPIDIIDTDFVGIEHFRFYAYDPIYPEELHADTTTSFCIAANASDLITLYADFDLDGLGDPNVFIESCEGVINYVSNSEDCDDTNYLECPADITISNDPGVCEATDVLLNDPFFNDCHVTLITNDAPLAFPVGNTIVRWTVEFNETAYKSCSQIVTVIDDEAPVPDIGGSNASWEEISNVVANDGGLNQQFGFDVDVSNEWAVVGARYDNELGTEAGAAYLLWFNGSTWVQHSKLLPSNGEKNDEFGSAISISNNRVLVGAPGHDAGGQEAGASYIFEYNGSSWIETAILVASNSSDNDGFGGSVSIHDDYAVIASIDEDSVANNSGAVYVFEYKNDWIENAILKANDAQSDDQFGYDVAVSGNHVIVGAKQEDTDGNNSGGAYIFERDEDFGTWFQTTKLLVSAPEAESEFGTSVDISGNHAVVGAPKNNTNGQDFGVAFVYSKNGMNWVEEQIIQPEDLRPGVEFGTSVSISANYIVAGAPYNFSLNPGEGAAYIFRNDGQEWNLQSLINASNSEIDDLFGSSVAIYGHNVISGARGKDDLFTDMGQSYIYNLNAGLPQNNSPCLPELDSPSATDNCDGIIEGIIEETSSYIGLGLYEIIWSYTDSSGNVTLQYQMVEPLQDTIPPTISCPSELNLILDGSGNLLVDLADSLITSTDNCGMLAIDYFPSSFSCSDLGTNTVEVTVEDALGNQASCEIEVVINEGPKVVENLNNNGSGSLRYLIEGSCEGAANIIYFDPMLNGTIQLLSNQILINKDIEIIGLGKDVINIDANNTMRIFEITPSSNVTLSDLQLSNGEEELEGGAFLNNGILNLDNIRLIGNREDGNLKAFSSSGQIRIIGGVVEVRE